MNRGTKSIVTGLLAGMMLASVAFANADEVVAPSSTDTATVTVTNVEEGATVTAYQIVEAEYTEHGLTQYKLVDEIGGGTEATTDDRIADFEHPTAAEITSLASDILAGKVTMATSTTLTASSDGTTYTKDVAAGSYLVLISGIEDGEYVYNPLIVSAGYTDANDASTLAQTAAIDVNTDSFLEGDVKAYAKKSYTTLDKDIVDASTGNSETEDVAVGDTVIFTVTTTIPNYSAFYTNVTFTLSDTADAGLGTPTITSVTVGGTKVEAGTTTYTTTITGNDWTIAFAADYLKNNPLKEVVVTYTADVTEDAVLAGTTPNASIDDLSIANKAELEYTTTPNETFTYEDTVSLYTFGFIGTKVDAKTNAVLKDAEFTLTLLDKDGKETTTTYTAVSDENGKFTFTDGIDVGTYKLEETKAPANYMLSDETYTITIAATYEEDADGAGATMTATRTAYANEQMTAWKTTIVKDSTGETVSDVTYDAKAVTTVDPNFTVKNTVLAKLPSTGGAGTIGFTLAGLAVVLVGVVLLVGKKKEH